MRTLRGKGKDDQYKSGSVQISSSSHLHRRRCLDQRLPNIRDVTYPHSEGVRTMNLCVCVCVGDGRMATILQVLQIFHQHK